MSRQREDAPGTGPTPGEQARQRLLAELPVAERRLTVAGIPTTVLEGGSGPPVLLVQVEFALVWSRIMSGLAATHRLIAPDLPGLGRSDLPPGTYDVNTLLRWLGDLIAQTCPSPPVLVGKGPGGALAARFAVDHSERLAGLVLVDSHGLEPFRPRPGMALSYLSVMVRPTQQRVERNLGTYCFTDLDRVRAEMGQHWDWFSTYTVHFFRTPKVRTAMRSLMPRLGRAIPPEDLARIGVPTTLIWGRGDIGMPVRVAEAAGARYGWPLSVIEDARDDPAMEQPDAFVAALRDALDRARPAPS